MSQPHDAEAERFWDAHYNKNEQVWSGRPNAVLVKEATGLTPGIALDLGCGEGADAIWLAQRGWRVTAVDISQTALERGARGAAAAGVAERVDWQPHDLAHTFPDGSYDLVSTQYLHSPVDLPRGRILRAAAQAVALGGTLLVVGHKSVPPWACHPHASFPEPAETLDDLGLDTERWDVTTCEARQRQTTGPDGEIGAVTESVIKALRRR